VRGRGFCAGCRWREEERQRREGVEVGGRWFYWAVFFFLFFLFLMRLGIVRLRFCVCLDSGPLESFDVITVKTIAIVLQFSHAVQCHRTIARGYVVEILRIQGSVDHYHHACTWLRPPASRLGPYILVLHVMP
jgi:hypothetical protein